MFNCLKKPSSRGLFLLILFFLVCVLPVAFLRVGYKFDFVSKELVLLVFFNLLVAGVLAKNTAQLKVKLLQVVLSLGSIPIFLLNLAHPHLLAVFGLYLLLLFLIPEIISAGQIFTCIAWSALFATIFSFYLHWSTAYAVVPPWLNFFGTSSRMSGPLGQPNLLACLIVVGLFVWLQVLWQRFGHVGWHWFYQLPVTIFFWALLLTGSKAGVLAFASAVLLLFLGLSRAGESKLLKFLVIQLAWSLSFGVLLFLLVQPPGIEISTDRAIDFTEQSSSTGSRLIYGGSALAMGYDNLWSGVGLGGYRRLLGGYMVPVAEWLRIPYDSINATLWAHNDFLHVFAECGLLVFLLLLFVFVSVLFNLSPVRNLRALFCFCAIWSFFVFMQFGHPFNNYVLVLYLVLLAVGALQLSPSKFILRVPKKLSVLLLAPCALFVNYYILSHALDMYHLKGYLQSVVASTPLSVERLTSLRAEHHYDDLVNDTLVGWEFKYAHLQALGSYTVQHSDPELAAYLIPDFEEFQSEHNSSALTYKLSRLYFLVRDYAVCKRTADIAYSLEPDMYHYSNFGHICLVFDISRREKIPITQLLSKKDYSELKEKKVFSVDMLDKNLRAL